MESCIIYQDESKTINVIDIPRSIEVAQGLQTKSDQRVILSSDPLEKPYPSLEPKSAKAISRVEQTPLSDLLLHRFIQLGLDEMRETFQGPWHLPRCTVAGLTGKRKREYDEHHQERKYESRGSEESEDQSHCYITFETKQHLILVPPKATFLYGNIEDTLALFSQNAPQFDLIVMDPPWPNRSARRKGSYGISYDSAAINSLLSSIPIKDHVADAGMVAVWVTNKPAFREMLLAHHGLFNQWGIEFVEEWVWLKVTSSGEPICELHSTWRKPYETLLIGRKRHVDVDTALPESINRRLIIAVPDLHSRKPNLKTLFKPLLKADYTPLEIFARHLTAGWWAWGNEVLKFQTDEHLVPLDHSR
ncbi:MT-A70-domain-containing protein [Xylogone sp. PMI_703]|nr:MT-A70-domain-containing protein [Xylogone sp. PMI_703]